MAEKNIVPMRGVLQIINAQDYPDGFPAYYGIGLKTVSAYLDEKKTGVYTTKVMTGDWITQVIPPITLPPDMPQTFEVTGELEVGSYVLLVEVDGLTDLWAYFSVWPATWYTPLKNWWTSLSSIQKILVMICIAGGAAGMGYALKK